MRVCVGGVAELSLGEMEREQGCERSEIALYAPQPNPVPESSSQFH